MPTKPTIARIWRARTRRADADEYEPYLRAGGIPPLEETALGFRLLRDDREGETGSPSFPAGATWRRCAFTKGEPTKVHLLPRDDAFLIQKPDRVEICRILIDRQGLR